MHHAHIPLSTFATHWTVTHVPCNIVTGKQEVSLQSYNLWQLFLLHNIPTISGSPLKIPGLTQELLAEYDSDGDIPENRDDILDEYALAIFPQVPHGSYFTYLVSNTKDHHCAECSHHNHVFPPGKGE